MKTKVKLQSIATEVEHSLNLFSTFTERVNMIAYAVNAMGGKTSIILDEDEEGDNNTYSFKFILGQYISPTISWTILEGNESLLLLLKSLNTYMDTGIELQPQI